MAATRQSRGISFRFSRAIVREPGQSVSSGLRAVNRGNPSYETFMAQHGAYVEALESAGVQLEVLKPLESFPDSVFIEDAALCFPEGIVLMRPGDPTRLGEAAVLGGELKELGYEVVANDTTGTIDGGDILITESAVLVGLSARTDRDGCDWLRSRLSEWGYTVEPVWTPRQVLHFKSDCCLLDDETILATHRLAGAECFKRFKVLTVPAGEEAAANAIRVNETVLLADGYPATAELLVSSGYRVVTIPVSQAALLDGGLSCMSLRLP